jgi:ATP-dependent exoDNAse (exonuclease V) beta subunit
MHSDPAVIILASAGTGKTHQLSNRYLKLLLSGAEARSILASTFTRKAAGEIGERVLMRLAEAVLTPAKQAELAKSLHLPTLSQKDYEETFTTFHNSLSQTQIATLDSIFISLARVFSFELGLPQVWDIFQETEKRELLEEACSDILSELDGATLRDLSKLLSLKDAPRSIHSLLMRTLPQYMHLLFDATEDAWSWVERPGGASDFPYQQLRETLAGLPLPLTAKGEVNKLFANGTKAVLRALEHENWREFALASIVQKVVNGEETYSRARISDEFVRHITSAFPAIEAELRAEISGFLSSLHTLLRHLALRFESQKDSRGLFSFDDVKRLLATYGMADTLETLYYRLSTRYEHMLLDEFQDTSREEFRVLAPFIQEISQGGDAGKTFFCVGDKKQAIYQWRGGIAEVFDELLKISPEFEKGVHHLDTSYRSSPVVLAFVNKIFAAARSFPESFAGAVIIRAWAEQFREHEAARAELPGFVSCLSSDDWQVDFIGAIRHLLSQRPVPSIGVLARDAKLLDTLQQLLLDSELGEFVAREGNTALFSSVASQVVFARLWQLAYPSDTEKCFLLNMLECSLNTSNPNNILTEREKFRSLGAGAYVQGLLKELPTISCNEFSASILIDAAFKAEASGLTCPSKVAHFIQSSSARIEASAKPVRLMTIHGSKGLEFDAVFLPEFAYPMRKSTTFGRELLTFRKTRMSKIEGVSLSLRNELATFIPEIQELKISTANEQIAEGMAVLYVALTRAKHALYIYLNEPNVSKSKRAVGDLVTTKASDLLRYALRFNSDGQNEFLDGDANWYATLQNNPLGQNQKRTPTISVNLRAVEHAQTVLTEIKPDEIMAPSDAKQVRQRLSKGTEIHGLLEEIEWLQQDEMPFFKRASTDQKDVLCKFFKHDEIAVIFSNNNSSSYRVYRELSLAAQTETGLISGRIDRLHLGEADAVIIDFKATLQGLDSEVLDKYRAQLRQYAVLVNKAFGIAPDKIRCLLLGVETPQVLEV